MAGDASVLAPYFTESVAYGSYGNEGRDPFSAEEALTLIQEQIGRFGPYTCPASDEELAAWPAELAQYDLDWLPDDAITCSADEYIFSFVPEGDHIVGYYALLQGYLD